MTLDPEEPPARATVEAIRAGAEHLVAWLRTKGGRPTAELPGPDPPG